PLEELQALQQLVEQLQGRLQDQDNALQQQQVQIAAIPGPIAPVPPRIKPDRPPLFSGCKTESLEAWVFQMQQYCILAPVPEADRIQFAATFFKEQAALWWRAYYQSIDWQNAAPDWDGFLMALRQQF